MKNKNTLKAIGILFVLTVILSWIIPSTTFSGYDLTKGNITPVGFWDFFASFATTIQYFYQPALLIVAIGGLYSLLVEIGVIEKLKTLVKKKFDGRERWFVVATITFFMAVTALTGIYLPMLIFVPFFIAAILNLGFEKKTALISTIGSIILGYGIVFFNSAVNQAALNITKITYIPAKFIILPIFIAVVSTIVTYNLKSKKVDKDKTDLSKWLLLDSTKTKRDIKVDKMWPFAVVSTIFVIILVLGLTPFGGMFNTTIFQDFHSWLVGLDIKDYPIASNLLGKSLPVFGNFQINDVVILLMFMTFAIAKVYKIKFGELVSIYTRGAKSVMNIALVASFINLIIVFAFNTQIVATMLVFIMNIGNDILKSLNKIDLDIPVISNIFTWLVSVIHMFSIMVTTFIASIFVIDNIYVANYTMPIVANLAGTTISKELLGFVGQMGYAISMLIAPTSIVLLVGLMYMEIPYTKWLKFIWKKALIILGFFLLVAAIFAKL